MGRLWLRWWLVVSRAPEINVFERAIAAIAPIHAAKRVRARMQILAFNNAAYEAADITRLRKRARDFGSGNTAVGSSAYHTRLQARHLGRNHDIVVGGLRTMVQNIIGANGIGVEPQPRDQNGDIIESVAQQLKTGWREWCKRPEVTRQHDYASMSRLKALTLFRDGEVFHQDLVGPVPYLEHGTSVPYSVELIEPDLLPLDFSDTSRNILQAVECNTWGRPVAYWVYKTHPGDPGVFIPDMKRMSADMIRHTKLIDRIGQRRGMSILASVLTRLEDLKDYEESERIAAKIAACFAAAIIKGDKTDYTSPSDGNTPYAQRELRMQPGMVFDDLRPGEDVKTIDSKRPNAQLEPYRNGQLRAVAGGMGVSFSSLAKNYMGTYSSQRQELVEQYGGYGVLAWEIIATDTRPVYERYAAVSLAAGELVVPRGVRIASIGDALYLPVQMPWIDPLKEAEAMALMEDHCFMSGQEIIRRRGADPNDVLDQQAAWLERKRLWGIPEPSNRDGFRLGADPGAAGAPDPNADPNTPPPGVDPNASHALSPRAFARRRFLSDKYPEETV